MRGAIFAGLVGLAVLAATLRLGRQLEEASARAAALETALEDAQAAAEVLRIQAQAEAIRAAALEAALANLRKVQGHVLPDDLLRALRDAERGLQPR
jgi:hypothetical protein